MALPDLYMEVVGYTRQGKTAEEIFQWLQTEHGQTMGKSNVFSHLSNWAKAGAFIVNVDKVQNELPTVGGPADGHYGVHRVNRYYSNAVALEPGVMARAIGVERANAVLARLGQAPIIIEPTPRRVPLQPAVIPQAQLPLISEPEPEPEPQRPPRESSQDLPSMLFGAQFTVDGVLISYEQFHRVVALLQHATEGQRG